MWTVASYKKLMRSSSDMGKLARASDSNELIKLLCFATADCRVWPHLRHHLIWLMLTTFYQETVMTTLWRHISVINPLDLTNPIYSVICSMLFSTFSHCAPLPGLVFLALSYIRPPPTPHPRAVTVLGLSVRLWLRLWVHLPKWFPLLNHIVPNPGAGNGVCFLCLGRTADYLVDWLMDCWLIHWLISTI